MMLTAMDRLEKALTFLLVVGLLLFVLSLVSEALALNLPFGFPSDQSFLIGIACLLAAVVAVGMIEQRNQRRENE